MSETRTETTTGEKKPIERAIRVFISSTFRDMREEREELVKQVFPELRRLCDSRAVVWSEVDLRWGVTDEEKADGKVLPICLAEIHNCRPYFLALLVGKVASPVGNRRHHGDGIPA
ncbi:MAG: DUF4062 domain-containing protein [Deltaproteobacteria bacterium]|nr:DUF4062 domain-containing protein [Deltaproteobacteria bacterium]